MLSKNGGLIMFGLTWPMIFAMVWSGFVAGVEFLGDNPVILAAFAVWIALEVITKKLR